MSSLLIILMQVALIAPLLFVKTGRLQHLPTLAVVYPLCLIALLGINDALADKSGVRLPMPSAAAGEAIGAVPNENCGQLMEIASRIELFGEIEDGSLPVQKRLWDQIPQEARRALIFCKSQTENGGRTLDVVER